LRYVRWSDSVRSIRSGLVLFVGCVGLVDFTLFAGCVTITFCHVRSGFVRLIVLIRSLFPLRYARYALRLFVDYCLFCLRLVVRGFWLFSALRSPVLRAFCVVGFSFSFVRLFDFVAVLFMLLLR